MSNDNDITHSFETWDDCMTVVTVARGVTFTNFDLSHEVAVSDGVIVASNIPEEIKSPEEARSWAALLVEAAFELERQGGE